jgi:integrase
MPTLIKRPGSPYFIACFDVPQPDGTTRRLKKSTKRTKRAEAMTEAIKLEEAERKGGTATGEQATKAFSILTQAAEAAARGELSEARGRELLAALVEISTGTPMRAFTVRTWAAEWLAMKAATSKPATMARYTAHIDTFTGWLGDRADSKLEAVTKADVRGFRDAIRTGWTPAEETPAVRTRTRKKGEPDQAPPPRTAKTTNHYASDLAGMFRAAVREGLLLASPAAALDRLPEHDSTERQVFTVAEVSRLVESAGTAAWQDAVFPSTVADTEARAARYADWQGMILLGFYAGARLGDCARLTWGAVDLDRGTLSFMPAKTKRKRKRLEVPLHPRLAAWLKTRVRKTTTDTAPLFPSLFDSPVGGRHGLSSMFIAIMDAAEIDRRTTREGTKGGQRAQNARSFHSLRHSLTSTLANLDVSEEIRRRIVGHESAEVHAGYPRGTGECRLRCGEFQRPGQNQG